jgi:hypothetical protein
MIEETLRILVRGSPVIESTYRIKPAYNHSETNRGNNTFNPPVDATPAAALPTTPP